MTKSESLRRMTTFAVVERIAAIGPHRDPEIRDLEVIELTNGVRLVTGKHYRVGDLGVYLRPGCLIPGILAEQLWMVGKQRAVAWFEVRDKLIGIREKPDEMKEPSPGLWCGEWYKDDKTDPESVLKARDFGVPPLVIDALTAAAGVLGNVTGTAPAYTAAYEAVVRALESEMDAEGFIHWRFWRSEWETGNCLDGHFGIVEATEQPAGTKHDRRFTAAQRKQVKQVKPKDRAQYTDPNELIAKAEAEQEVERELVLHPFRLDVRTNVGYHYRETLPTPFITTVTVVKGWDLVRALLRGKLEIRLQLSANHWAVGSRLAQKFHVWATRGLPMYRPMGRPDPVRVDVSNPKALAEKVMAEIAHKHRMLPQSYAQGGIIPGPHGESVHIVRHPGERVLRPTEMASERDQERKA